MLKTLMAAPWVYPLGIAMACTSITAGIALSSSLIGVMGVVSLILSLTNYRPKTNDLDVEMPNANDLDSAETPRTN